MPVITASQLSIDKRCFLGKLINYGVATLSFQPFDLHAQRRADAHIALPSKPWLALNLTALEIQTGSSAQAKLRAPSFWPSSNPTLRLTHWSRTALALIVKYQQNPLRAARMLAYLHIGMHDAWHYTCSTASPNSGNAATLWQAENAAHEAAAQIMAHFYPNETPGVFSALLATLQASLPFKKSSISTAVATTLIERSLRDGAGKVWPIKQRPVDFTGIWQASYPLYAVNPTEGYAGIWQPWVTPSASRYSPPTAARPGSAQHTLETEEVFKIFNSLTETQTQAAQKWHLESGSVTPAGIWVGIALNELKSHEQTSAHHPVTTLQTLSSVCAAMHDAFIACWQIKFRDWSERPITAIRRSKDSNFIPLLVTPGFPSYVSGHATISAAAAHVLGIRWPEQRSKFQTMAQEAADSRLWGGIHFRSDNEEGLKLGEAVGHDTVSSRS
jgi:hypothetical protein